MGGGLMQLVAYGSQDIYLTGNPQITFFKVAYKRYTNFSIESITQFFKSTPDFGRHVTVNLSKNADLLKLSLSLFKSFSLMYSSLCIEMLLTVTPPTTTGSSLATGVTAPVLPTWNSTFNSLLVPCRALNLNAIAQRG